MELTNDFRVAVDRPTTWKALTDLERIAPLLPGAQLQEVEGQEYRGIVKVKVGPITAQYKGTATLTETDEAAGRMVLAASGRDTRGQGNANATITVTVADDGDGTTVHAVTDLTISGKVAQFGRGVLADVSTKLIGQFAENLEQELGARALGGSVPGAAGADSSDPGASETGASGPGGSDPGGEVGPGTTAPTTTSATTTSSRSPERVGEDAPGSGPATSPGVRTINAPEPEPVDLLGAAGNPLLKRLAPLGVGLVLAVVLVILRRRR